MWSRWRTKRRTNHTARTPFCSCGGVRHLYCNKMPIVAYYRYEIRNPARYGGRREALFFETGFLLVGDVDPADVRRQLSRWVNSGHIVQLRRGLYALAPPYRKTSLTRSVWPTAWCAGRTPDSLSVCPGSPRPHPGARARITSVTTGRPQHRENPFGSFEYHHCSPNRRPDIAWRSSVEARRPSSRHLRKRWRISFTSCRAATRALTCRSCG